MTIHSITIVSAIHVLVLVLGFPDCGHAQTSSREARVSGMGVRKCAEWQQWKETRNGEARAMALEWTQGFISGHNVYARTGIAASNSVVADMKVLIPLVDSFCERNPESQIFSVVIQITQSLGGAKVIVEPKAPAPTNPQRSPPAPADNPAAAPHTQGL